MKWLVELLGNVKLTVTQWALLSLAALVGGLVLALRLQGSKLHRAQLELMGKDLDQKIDTAHAKTEEARTRYQDAIADFIKAGGKLLLCLALLASTPPAKAESDGMLYLKCQSALSACDSLAKAQDQELIVSRQATTAWKDKAMKGTSTSSVLWVATGGGAAGGCATGALLNQSNGSLLVGCGAGLITGFVLGLLVR